MQVYKTIHESGSDEVTIEKSIFIGYAKPISTEEEAREFIDEIKRKHKDATHNVWAYTIGQNMNIQRYSDDGEPQGTAGIPTLEVIKKEDLRDVVVVVTRYFGGIKLGAGGLVRAYTKGAKIGIEAGKIVEKVPFTQIDILIDYTLLGKMQNSLSNKGFVIKGIEYAENVVISVYCEDNRLEELKNLIVETTNANSTITEKCKQYISVKDGKIIENNKS
ncbi:YigZ family protein [Peptostreptococcus canis]|uniref:YigZ family protein n=1 Tax=Peptostreptococcus canis TaxID=1159213 RepID=A0ABR6TK68_9FIRM|nr:YigZ family protein [Peptostreptococcus canis]MBC2575396.1 YigZ family protein [Peptostreptococcus canis]MBP1997420.1 putative YigZ family protein [Peptostreptococcus canis]